ncbi:hypothetical protein C8R45DRAFT_948379 [Mycena sanguinolenta]|nr:hypothetical protein C8R45DRAFT_948379 [Mycena sanguinolenta]
MFRRPWRTLHISVALRALTHHYCPRQNAVHLLRALPLASRHERLFGVVASDDHQANYDENERNIRVPYTLSPPHRRDPAISAALALLPTMGTIKIKVVYLDCTTQSIVLMPPTPSLPRGCDLTLNASLTSRPVTSSKPNVMKRKLITAVRMLSTHCRLHHHDPGTNASSAPLPTMATTSTMTQIKMSSTPSPPQRRDPDANASSAPLSTTAPKANISKESFSSNEPLMTTVRMLATVTAHKALGGAIRISKALVKGKALAKGASKALANFSHASRQCQKQRI